MFALTEHTGRIDDTVVSDVFGVLNDIVGEKSIKGDLYTCIPLLNYCTQKGWCSEHCMSHKNIMNIIFFIECDSTHNCSV